MQSVVPTLPEWAASGDADAAAAQAELRRIWADARLLVTEHEGQTEEHWVRPVLRALGYAFQVQTAIPDATGTTRWPDYALFADEAGRAAASSFAGTTDYF